MVDDHSLDGVSPGELLGAVEPMSQAKYVEFVTLLDPVRMPNQRSDVLEWPYVEGLRMDEALHPLTILASGLYGNPLPPRMERRFGWWCHGSMGSRESSRS
jgi:sulfoxide reductase catalytic subunit YedY